MCDTAIATENQDSYIIWLACKLRLMAEDILQFATYDESDETAIEHYRRYMKDAINFMAGAHTCERFLYGSIGLDGFCAEMLNEELGSFLHEIPYLPNELILKYGLVHGSDFGEIDVSDGIHNPNISNDIKDDNNPIAKNGIDVKVEGGKEDVSETVDLV